MRNDAKYATYVFFNFFFRWMKNLSALKNLLTSIVSSTWKQEKAIMYNCLIKKAHIWWHISLITNLCVISMLYFCIYLSYNIQKNKKLHNMHPLISRIWYVSLKWYHACNESFWNSNNISDEIWELLKKNELTKIF